MSGPTTSGTEHAWRAFEFPGHKLKGVGGEEETVDLVAGFTAAGFEVVDAGAGGDNTQLLLMPEARVQYWRMQAVGAEEQH